ncbi:MAG: hypothetical protein IKX86_03735 [Clostridia bacterium]|nr:hypothetical protein [Clostridia bacterium]
MSAKAPKRGGNGRLAIELAAGGVLLFVMVLAVAIGPGLIRKDYVEPGVTGDTKALVEPHAADGVWYCNNIGSIGEPPFSLPDGSPEISGKYYSYKKFSVSNYNKFISSLTDSGFELATKKYSSFLFRDDCMIFLQYDAYETLSLSWYSRSRYAEDDGDTSSLLWYDNKDSLSKIKIHPINISPEGFYDLTGGQIYAIPVYSYDRYNSAGQEDINGSYDCSVCFVKDNKTWQASMESVAVCDIDGDQINDVLLLSYGPTSGVFTFRVVAVTESGVYDTVFGAMEYYDLGFANEDGKIVVEGVGNDLKQHFFEIVFSKNGQKPVVMLYDNGEPLPTWVLQGVLDYQSHINDKYWFDYLGLNERALVEEEPQSLMLEYRITADDADSPIWSASDGELIPFVIRRTRYLDSSDYRSALKKIVDKGTEANQETRYRLVAEKTGLTYETVKNLIENAEYMGSNIDELYDIAGQEYVDLVLSTRPSQEVVDAYNAVIYDERYKTAYLDAIRDPDNLLFYKDDAEKLKNERFEEMKTLVENEGCMIVADLNDEKWANTLASLRGYCVAFGTAAQVKSLLGKLDYETELFYAPRKPFGDDWLFGYVDPDTVNWEAIQDKWPNQLLDEEALYFRQNINSKALYIK